MNTQTNTNTNTTPVKKTNIQLITPPEVWSGFNRSKSAILSDRNDGLMVNPISLGTSTVRYLAHEVNAIIKARAVGATKDELRELVKELTEQRQHLEFDLFGGNKNDE